MLSGHVLTWDADHPLKWSTVRSPWGWQVVIVVCLHAGQAGQTRGRQTLQRLGQPLVYGLLPFRGLLTQ